MRKRVTFANSNGVELAGTLEIPEHKQRGAVLFAHCFTCGKNALAATRIARVLVNHGYTVLRFDFTGLGNSEGDFANSNFSSNIEDLVSAADFMRSAGQPADILIGHSLGGTAVLAAAHRIESVQGVVTIAAPATPAHILKHLEKSLPEIDDKGCAMVSLGGREFPIQKQFVADVQAQTQKKNVESLGLPLLLFHSPNDSVVSITEADTLFAWAAHPKSFVALASGDHLITQPENARYIADTLAQWADQHIHERTGAEADHAAVARGEVLVTELNHRFTRGVYSDEHQWLADEPEKAGGDNTGPDPYELLLAALGACTSMTIRMVANRKQWPLEDVEVRLSHSRVHREDCEHCDEAADRPSGTGLIDVMDRVIRLTGASLTPEQKESLLKIADKCPVHRTLENQPVVRTRLL
jgi:uncharacterized OsmC-like protein/esterase/lipase